jgi:hypothetical protein
MPDVQQPRWQPDYRALTSWRATALESLRAYPASGRGAYLRYHDDPAAFIDHWAEKNVELVSAAHGARADPWQAIPETCLWVHVLGQWGAQFKKEARLDCHAWF